MTLEEMLEESEVINRRINNAMAKRYQRGNQKSSTEELIIQ